VCGSEKTLGKVEHWWGGAILLRLLLVPCRGDLGFTIALVLTGTCTGMEQIVNALALLVC